MTCFRCGETRPGVEPCDCSPEQPWSGFEKALGTVFVLIALFIAWQFVRWGTL